MKSILSLVFFFLASGLLAQIKKVEIVTRQANLYSKAEWNIYLKAKFDNPYFQEQVALDMHIETPSGKSIVLPCYYEAGSSDSISLWKARFTPQEKGQYHYRFQLSEHKDISSTSKRETLNVRTSSKKGFLHIGNNWVLRYDNNTAFRGIGENIAWESRQNDDSKYFKKLQEQPKYNYEYMLRSLAKHGGNFFRTWICQWNLPIDWKSGFNNTRYTSSTNYYNPSALEKLDRLVNLCDSLDLHIMLTLGPGAYDIKHGGVVSSAAEFFVSPAAAVRYKNRLRYIIARWGYSPSIGAWELFNEVDNVMYANKDKPIAAATIVHWHDEMSKYIKQIDPYKHIVTTSISHRDLPGLNDLKAIDINQKHIYKNTKSIPSTIVQYEKTYHKPYVIGEYGYEWDWSKNFDDFAGEMDSDFKRGLWYGLFSPTPILPMSWWWEYFDNRGTDAYILKVRKILNQMLRSGNGAFDTLSVSVSNARLIKYAVKCGNSIFIYLFNPNDSLQSGSLELANSWKLTPHIQVYDCNTGEYKQGKIINSKGILTIPSFNLSAKTDRVIIITSKSSKY